MPMPSTDPRLTRPQPPALRRWLSQAEAADYYGVTDRTIRNYIARGILPASRVRGSRLVRIDRNDLDALLRPTANPASVHGTLTRRSGPSARCPSASRP